MHTEKNKFNTFTCFLTRLTLISLVFMININSHATDLNQQAESPVFLILGDSLSAGYGIAQEKNWVSLLQQRFNSKNINLHIINASISGDTTANGLIRLSKALHKYQPAYLLIELGANDGLRGLPLSLIRSNLKKMIQLVSQLGQPYKTLSYKTKVLLMAIRIPPNYGKKYTQRFNALYSELAQEMGVKLLPFMLNNIAVHSELMQADRLHPTEQAQALIMEHVWDGIREIVSPSPYHPNPSP